MEGTKETKSRGGYVRVFRGFSRSCQVEKGNTGGTGILITLRRQWGRERGGGKKGWLSKRVGMVLRRRLGRTEEVIYEPYPNADSGQRNVRMEKLGIGLTREARLGHE